MTTKLKVLAMLIGVSSMGFAATPSSIEIKKDTDSKIVRVVYHGQSAGTVKVNIFDESGAMVLTKTIKNQPNFSLPVNFENQSSGKYTITVADASGSQSKEVTLGQSKAYYSLVTPLSDNRYLVSVSNPSNDIVNINVIDEDGNTIASQETSSDTALLFNLSKVKGEPTFEISAK